MDGMLKTECECCHKETTLENIRCVCEECLRQTIHIQKTNSLFKMDWEDKVGNNDDSDSNNL